VATTLDGLSEFFFNDSVLDDGVLEVDVFVECGFLGFDDDDCL
jgi:hypothetical protein